MDFAYYISASVFTFGISRKVANKQSLIYAIEVGVNFPGKRNVPFCILDTRTFLKIITVVDRVLRSCRGGMCHFLNTVELPFLHF